MRERERREGVPLHYLDPSIFLSSSSLFSLGVLSSWSVYSLSSLYLLLHSHSNGNNNISSNSMGTLLITTS